MDSQMSALRIRMTQFQVIKKCGVLNKDVLLLQLEGLRHGGLWHITNTTSKRQFFLFWMFHATKEATVAHNSTIKDNEGVTCWNAPFSVWLLMGIFCIIQVWLFFYCSPGFPFQTKEATVSHNSTKISLHKDNEGVTCWNAPFCVWLLMGIVCIIQVWSFFSGSPGFPFQTNEATESHNSTNISLHKDNEKVTCWNASFCVWLLMGIFCFIQVWLILTVVQLPISIFGGVVVFWSLRFVVEPELKRNVWWFAMHSNEELSRSM